MQARWWGDADEGNGFEWAPGLEAGLSRFWSTRSGLAPESQIGFPEIPSSSRMYNKAVGKESAQKIMKQTGDLKAATLYFAS